MKVEIALLAIVTILLAAGSLAAIDATYTCHNSQCREGTPINYSIYVSNSVNGTIEISLIRIFDADTGQLISSYRLNKILQPAEDFRVTYEDAVTAPKSGYTFQYVPCIDVKIAGTQDSPEVVCDRTKRSLTVLPLSKIQCEVDSQCKGNEFCDKTYRCKALACGNYSFPILHQCTNYNALWAAIGIAAAIAIAATFFMRQRYKRARLKKK